MGIFSKSIVHQTFFLRRHLVKWHDKLDYGQTLADRTSLGPSFQL